MKRLRLAPLVAGLLIVASITPVHANHQNPANIGTNPPEPKQPCYYYQPKNPDESPKFFSCSNNEQAMIGVKIILKAIDHRLDNAMNDEEWSTAMKTWIDWWFIAKHLEEAGNDVRLDVPLEHYHVTDYMKLGDNVTVYTIPNGKGGYNVRFDDRFTERPIKVAGKWTTNQFNCMANAGLNVLAGVAVGQLLEASGNFYTTSINPSLASNNLNSVLEIAPAAGALTGIAIDETADSLSDNIPTCGTTEVLYDLLNPVREEKGHVYEAQVYRVNLRITADGNISTVLNGAAVDGEKVYAFWHLGNASKDSNGRWVW